MVRDHTTKMLSGSADYSLQLQLNPSNAAQTASIGQLQVSSTLQNVEALLARTFTNNAAAKLLTLTVDLLRNNQQTYRFHHNQQYLAHWQRANGALTGGDIQLLSLPTITPNVDGKLFLIQPAPCASADIQQWIDLITSHNKLSTQTTATTTTQTPVSIRFHQYTTGYFGKIFHFPI
ncbi:MAG: hypothetical protein IPN27_11440 [Cellvibrionales bacterium]|nr:hypothetical protein [Cellvibrionales bacterium]